MDVYELIRELRAADKYNGEHYERDPLHKKAADALDGLLEEQAERALTSVQFCKDAPAYNKLRLAHNRLLIAAKMLYAFPQGFYEADWRCLGRAIKSTKRYDPPKPEG